MDTIQRRLKLVIEGYVDNEELGPRVITAEPLDLRRERDLGWSEESQAVAHGMGGR